MKRAPLLAIALLMLALPLFAMSRGKVATINGLAMLSNGKPASGVEVTIKDSWAGAFSMRERELFRTKTDSQGKFSAKGLVYRHTIDILLQDECVWTHNGTISEKDRNIDGSYDYKTELVLIRDCQS